MNIIQGYSIIHRIIFLSGMYIQPGQYLDLTQRINILTNKYEKSLSQRSKLSQKVVSMEQKIRFLQARIQQMVKDKQKQQLGIKQHVSDKTQVILNHISQKKQDEKKFIQEQINKVRNWSAINTLKKMQDRIMENKSSSAQKQFFQKVKTLYVIEKRKTSCNQIQLFEWITQLLKIKKSLDTDPLADMSNISKIMVSQSQKSINKNLNKSQKPGIRQSNNLNKKTKQNQSHKKLSVIEQNQPHPHHQNAQSLDNQQSSLNKQKNTKIL